MNINIKSENEKFEFYTSETFISLSRFGAIYESDILVCTMIFHLINNEQRL